MSEVHHYAARTVWTGAALGPTLTYDGYSRDYSVEIAGKTPLDCSADAVFRGDPDRHNPEDMLVAALSACHMLTYLACCARARIAVVAYEDAASGTMAMKDGRMRFTEVVLRPRVTLAEGANVERARRLHATAHDTCFIACSVNFPVRHEAEVILGAPFGD